MVTKSSSYRDRIQIARFSYFKSQPRHEHEKPCEILIDLPDEAKHVPRSNLAFEVADCKIQDVRGREQTFTLDKNGFMWQKSDTMVEDLKDKGFNRDGLLQ